MSSAADHPEGFGTVGKRVFKDLFSKAGAGNVIAFI